MNKRIISFVMFLVFPLVLTSCDGDRPANITKQENKVVAEVNGESVYMSEINELKKRMLRNVPASYINKELEDKLLDSLIRSKAMAQLMKKELDEETENSIENQVNAFREDLLVKAYVDKYGLLKTVTNEQVKQYYADNLNLFGGGNKKTVEYLEAKPVADREKRVELLKTLNSMKTIKHWKKSVHKLTKKGFKIDYKKLTANVKHLKSPLKEIVKKLSKQTEPQLVSDTGIYLVRVLDTETIPALPFAEVSGDVRAMLQRHAYRESIENLSDKVMKQSQVKIISASADGK